MARVAAVWILVAASLAACGGSGSSKPATFTNPVLRADFPDPFVLRVDSTYYAYATQGNGKNIQVARSDDLVHWRLLDDALPTLGAWATSGNTWAPEVLRVGKTYVLFYVAYGTKQGRQCLGRATAAAPEGPFRDDAGAPFLCQTDEGGSIDPDPFRDSDGSLYLLWKNDGNCCGIATWIYAQRLSADASKLVGAPARLLTADQWQWEGSLVEAPTLWKEDGRYTLFFSASVYNSPDYAVGYAGCRGPLGPCTAAKDNPILKSACRAAGPGHQAIVRAPDGAEWLVYHAWPPDAVGASSPGRQLWIDRLEWRDGAPVVRGPTCRPQPAPARGSLRAQGSDVRAVLPEMCVDAAKSGRGRERRLPLLCECGDPWCVERVRMTVSEYLALPATPPGLALAPGHEPSGQRRQRRRRHG